MTTITSNEFRQNSRKAQEAAETAPVFITKRGKPTQVLMSYADYQKLAGKPQNGLQALTPPPELAATLAEIEFEIPDRRQNAADMLRALQHPDVADIELDIPSRSKAQRRPVEF